MKRKFLKFKILAFTAILIVSCSKSDEEVPIEETIQEFVSVPKMTEEELNSFRTFSSIDELNLSDYSNRITPPPASYSIPNFPAPHLLGQRYKASCVAWSSAYYIMSYYFNATLSPDFVYYSMVNNNIMSCPNGASPSKYRDFLVNNGTCKLTSYGIQGGTIKSAVCNHEGISQNAKDEALNYKVSDFLLFNYTSSPNPNEDIKQLVSSNIPVGVSIALDKGFQKGEIDTNGRYIYKQKEDKWLVNDKKEDSFHAVTIIGYSNALNAFKVINSWGTSWGMNGYFWLDYNYLPSIVDGVWFIKKKELLTESTSTNIKLFTNFNKNIMVGAIGGSDFGGIGTGVDIETYSGLNLYKFSKVNHSRIEYNLNNSISGAPDQIPSQGTFEVSMFVKNSYQYSNYILNEDKDDVTILTTDNTGLDTHWPGSMRLIANKNGTIDFYINSTKYSSTLPDHLQAQNTSFAFNKWSRIGISYGNQGMYISVNGVVVASDATKTRIISNGGNHTLQNDKPTIGEAKSYYPWNNLQWTRGFNGYVYKVRTSATQQDFKLSL